MLRDSFYFLLSCRYVRSKESGLNAILSTIYNYPCFRFKSFQTWKSIISQCKSLNILLVIQLFLTAEFSAQLPPAFHTTALESSSVQENTSCAFTASHTCAEHNMILTSSSFTLCLLALISRLSCTPEQCTPGSFLPLQVASIGSQTWLYTASVLAVEQSEAHSLAGGNPSVHVNEFTAM